MLRGERKHSSGQRNKPLGMANGKPIHHDRTEMGRGARSDLRRCGWIAIRCKQVTNWAVDSFNYPLKKDVVVNAALRCIGPQCFRLAMLELVVARFCDQLPCRLGGQRWRQYDGSSKSEDDETGNVSQQRDRFRWFHGVQHPDNVPGPSAPTGRQGPYAWRAVAS